MKLGCALLTLGWISSLHSAELKTGKANESEIRVVSVTPTVEADDVTTTILFPTEGKQLSGQPVSMQIRLDGFPLATDSDFPRRKEVYNDPEGQSLHIFVDDLPYFAENTAFIDSLDDNEEYFEQMLEFHLPMRLKPGMHIVRVFPVRSYNESLKGDGCFAVRTFYLGSKTPAIDVNLSKPYLTYNEPQGSYESKKNQPILLDFYVTNATLSKDGYKVQLTIDGTEKRTLSSWTPYYIYGLKKGKHTIRLQLLDGNNKQLPGIFNDVTNTFTID